MRIMRFLVLCLFVTVLMLSPVYMLDKFLMPQVESLQATYANADKIAERAADGAASGTE